MNKDDIQKLIGGYATGTLTEDERKALFEAALEDQELFDSLQDDQVLKELFDDPISREQVRAAVAESLPERIGAESKAAAEPQRAREPWFSWFRKPWIWASAASAAMAAVLVLALVRWDRLQAPSNGSQKPMVATDQRPAPAPVLADKTPPADQPEAPKQPDKPAAGKPDADGTPPAAEKSEVHRQRGPTARESYGRNSKPLTIEAPRGVGRTSSSGYRASRGSVSDDAKREYDIARNSPSGPSNSNSTLRNADTDRNSAPPAKEPSQQDELKKEDRPRNEIALSRPAPAPPAPVVPSPAPAPTNPAQQSPPTTEQTVQEAEKLQARQSRAAPESGHSQSQYAQQQYSAGGGARRDSAAQATLEQPATKVPPNTKTEAAEEASKDQRKSKALSGGMLMNRSAAGRGGAPPHYSLARQGANGSFVAVSAATPLKSGDVLRLTVTPSDGPVSILEWDENDPQWRQVYPPSDAALDAGAKQTARYTFVVRRSLRVRVVEGATTTDIPIRISEAVK